MRNKFGYGYIYMIVNNANHKTYIGKKAFPKGCPNITYENDNYLGSGKIIKQAISKEGAACFEKFLICYTESEKDACEKEKFWIDHYRKLGKAEYNICDGGKFGYRHKKGDGPNKGKHFSEETKHKMSEAKKGKVPYIHTRETNEKIGAVHRGMTWRFINGKRVWLDKEEKL